MGHLYSATSILFKKNDINYNFIFFFPLLPSAVGKSVKYKALRFEFDPARHSNIFLFPKFLIFGGQLLLNLKVYKL